MIDEYDLALLNYYIRSRSERPEGISALRRCEVNAADISGDGYVDEDDVNVYLTLICK